MSEIQTPTWRVIKKWAEDQIEVCKRALEEPLLYEREADTLRGRIAELRALLNLTEPKPEVPESGDLADSD